MAVPLSTPPQLGTRIVITKLADHIVQGVYSTYVGKIPTLELKQFLTIVIENHRTLQAQSNPGEVWTMGDFNLQGIVPGHHNTPRETTQRHRISQWMENALKAYDLQGVVTPVTHTTGPVLDVHITKMQESTEQEHTLPSTSIFAPHPDRSIS